MAFPDLDDLPEPVRDLLDVTVGLGLLTFQRAQVQRRAFEKRIEKIEPDLPDPARSVARNVRVVSETVGEGLARLLVPGDPSRGPASVRYEPTRREPEPDHSQDPDPSQAHVLRDAAAGESLPDNHLEGRPTDRQADGRGAEVEPNAAPDETHEG